MQCLSNLLQNCKTEKKSVVCLKLSGLRSLYLLAVTFETMCSKGLRATFLSTDTEVWAGQNAWITTETLIVYSLCYRLVFFVFSHFTFQFATLFLSSVRLGRQALWLVLVVRWNCATSQCAWLRSVGYASSRWMLSIWFLDSCLSSKAFIIFLLISSI